MSKLLLTLAICSSFLLQAQPKVVDGVMAVVGNNIILLSDIEQQYLQIKAQGLPMEDNLKCGLFKEQLFEKLLLHQAAIDSVEVTEDEVGSVIQRRLDYFISQVGSIQALESYYGKTIPELKEELKKPIRQQLIAQKMQNQISGGLQVSPKEVEEFFNEIPKDSLPLINAEVEVAQIVKKPVISEAARTEARQQLLEFRERILNGENFASLAILYSEDPGSARNGGKYTDIQRGQFVKEFEAAVFGLEPMELSEVFETEYGFHLAQLLERRGQVVDVRHILIKPEISSESIQESANFLDSLRQAILDGDLSFETAALEYSDDKQTQATKGNLINQNTSDTRFEVGQLDRNVYFAIENLNPGEISKPVFMQYPDGSQAYRIIKLVSRTEPHRANLKRDYSRIKNVALEQKKQKVINDWVDEKLKVTFVKINSGYLDCTLDPKWTRTYE